MAEAHHHPKPAEDGPTPGTVRGTQRSRLLGVMILTGITMGVEVAGGLWSGSIALLGDAFHMMSHFLAMSLS